VRNPRRQRHSPSPLPNAIWSTNPGGSGCTISWLQKPSAREAVVALVHARPEGSGGTRGIRSASQASRRIGYRPWLRWSPQSATGATAATSKQSWMCSTDSPMTGWGTIHALRRTSQLSCDVGPDDRSSGANRWEESTETPPPCFRMPVRDRQGRDFCASMAWLPEARFERAIDEPSEAKAKTRLRLLCPSIGIAL